MREWFKKISYLAFIAVIFTATACAHEQQADKANFVNTISSAEDSPPPKKNSSTREEITKEAFQEARYQQELIISNKKENLDKLLPVAFNLLEANVDLCEDNDSTLSYGFYTDISQFLARDSRPVPPLTTSTHFPAPVQVIYIVSSGPSSGKLQPNDEILSINGIQLDMTLDENYRVLARTIERASQALPSLTPTKFRIKRGEKILDTEIKPVKLCNYPVYLNQSGKLNAYADGYNIYVNSSILNIADSPDKIALIIGHEMAHNEMLHIQRKNGTMILNGIKETAISVLTGIPFSGMVTRIGKGSHTKYEHEEEADYFGAYYAARAGYDIGAAFEIWRKIATHHPSSLHLEGTSTHPSTARRLLAVRRASAEIERKLENGQPLEPSVEMVARTKQGLLLPRTNLLPFN